MIDRLAIRTYPGNGLIAIRRHNNLQNKTPAGIGLPRGHDNKPKDQ